MLRVLALVPYPLGRAPGQRYRIEQWAPKLADHGIQVTFSPFLAASAMTVLYERGHVAAKLRHAIGGYVRRLRESVDAHAADVVYVYREAAPLAPLWAEELFGRRLPLVFDFDDAIYLPAASAANAWTARVRAAGKTRGLCRMARRVIAGNETLARYARDAGAQVAVVPSTIDTDVYVPAARPANPRPVVGWTGSATTLAHLDAIRPALARLRLLGCDLRVVGSSAAFDGIEAHCLPWRAETEVEDLRPIDVGLMPLPDDEWSRGKCGMKALQYMALGIPPVVSPIGVNATIVRDGVNGFHARTEDEWVDRVARLIGDPALRARLGAAARQTVERDFSTRVHVPRVAALLREAAA